MPNLMSNQRQFSHSNWKLYAENTRDPYHASLLHLFHNTFGLYRSTQTGECLMDESKRHSFLYSKAGSNDAASDSDVYQDSRSFEKRFSHQDPPLPAGRSEFPVGHTPVILVLYSNPLLQQISNTLAVRQTLPHGPDTLQLGRTPLGS